MPESEHNVPGSVAAVLSALRSLPLWILAGLALAGWVVVWLLFFPPIAHTEVIAFRSQWGIWIGIGALGFSVLGLARAIDMAVLAYLEGRRARSARRTLRLVPLARNTWWHLAKQRDDSWVSQVSLSCQMSNSGDRPAQVIKVRLIRPWAKEVNAFAVLPREGSPYYSGDHAIPPQGSVGANIHLMVRRVLAAQGKPLKLTIGVVDQFGEEYVLRRVTVPSHDRPLPKASILARLRRLQQSGRALLERLGLVSPRPPEPVPSMPWVFDASAGYLETCNAVLREEKRSYAARGRRTGQLGSLNVGLQSEPNLGWTREGEVPALLWEEGKGKQVSSANLHRLVALRNSLPETERGKLESYLLSHLRKDSEFADVGYFLFLALHRMGRTVDALSTARTFLAGDKVFGYSNLLGTLSAVVSHEHSQIDDGLHRSILSALADDGEHDFRLREKINLALLRELDQPRMAGETPSA
jgi:hypothetical protein